MRRLVGLLVGLVVLIAPASTWAQAANPFIQGGTRPEPGAWPWMVFIVAVDSSGDALSACSGELIGPTTVLTAAHCLDPVNDANYVVSAAQSNPGWDNGSAPYQPSSPYETVRASAAVVDPGYSVDSLSPFNDVGIIPLPAPLTGTSWLPLVQPDEVSPFATPSGFSGLAAGYGLTAPNTRSVGYLFQTEIDSAVIDTYSGDETDTTGAAFDYSNPSSGTCEGDSGGPLLVPVGGGTLPVTTNPTPTNGDWAVVGIVHAGPANYCFSGSYTNVAYNVAGVNDVADWLAPYETPVDYEAPSISGDPVVGQTLTCEPGTWAEPAASFTYTWETVGTGGVTPINGANAQTYTPTSTYLGSQLECAVKATVPGFGSTNSATSAPVTISLPSVNVSPTSGKPGTSVTVSGQGFNSGRDGQGLYETGLASPTSVTICTATAISDTSYTCTGTIPPKARAGAHIAHKIMAKGRTSGLKAKTTFTLT